MADLNKIRTNLIAASLSFLFTNHVLTDDSLPRSIRVPKPDKFISSSDWGSRPDPINETRRHTPRWITIHHAGVDLKDGETPLDFVRNLQKYGKEKGSADLTTKKKYWPDVPYHFMIASDGTIYEGRPLEYEPESNTSYPLSGNIGIELMGNFERERPRLGQLESAVRLTAWVLQEKHLDPEQIRTHLDVAATACPGKHLYPYFASGKFKRWVLQVMMGEHLELYDSDPIV